MTLQERKNQVRSYLGKTVEIRIDRPIGYVHRKEKYSLTYPINYGYIPGVLGGDGEELDVYLLGVSQPVERYTAKIIGIVHRRNDVEDKLIAAPEGMIFYQNEIAEQIRFQEQYYDTYIEALYARSCGTVPYTIVDGAVRYLLIRSHHNGDCGLPKGHMELGETEHQTALRETLEETSVSAEILPGFRDEVSYRMPNGRYKSAVYFLAQFAGQTPHHNEGFEHSDYLLLPYEDALNALTFESAKDVLRRAETYRRSIKPVYLWIGLGVDKNEENFIRTCCKQSNDFGVSEIAFSLPQHISLKTSFPTNQANALIGYLKDKYQYLEKFTLETEGIQTLPGIVWLKIKETPLLRNMHNEINHDLREKFAIPFTGYDGDTFEFHSTLFFDMESSHGINALFEKLRGDAFHNKGLSVDRMYFGTSPSGNTGTYEVVDLLELK